MKAIETWPESIFLQHGQPEVPDYGAKDPAGFVFWCPSQQTPQCIEYVRADLVPSWNAKATEPRRPARQHDLKTDPEVFEAVFTGRKTHEIRLNDRDFRPGDRLVLRETRYSGDVIRKTGAAPEYTGRVVNKTVSHVLSGYGLMPGWVILSFEPEATCAS